MQHRIKIASNQVNLWLMRYSTDCKKQILRDCAFFWAVACSLLLWNDIVRILIVLLSRSDALRFCCHEGEVDGVIGFIFPFTYNIFSGNHHEIHNPIVWTP